MNKPQNKKSFWGFGIAALYTGFALFIISFVIFATFQDFSLVEENYYSKELVYQKQIDRIKNYASLTDKPSWSVDQNNKLFTLIYPDSIAQVGINGTIHFFRPSNKQHDQIMKITLNNNNQMEIPLSKFIKGQWRIKLSWESGGKEFYNEKLFTI